MTEELEIITPKKKRGRPAGAKNKKPVTIELEDITEDNAPNNVGFDLLETKEVTDVITVNSIKYLFDCVAILFGEHWKISTPQAKELYTAFSRCADKLPKKVSSKYKKYFDSYTPFIQLAITLGVVIYPRYVATIQPNQSVITSKANDGETNTDSGNGEEFTHQDFDFAENVITNNNDGDSSTNNSDFNEFLKGYPDR